MTECVAVDVGGTHTRFAIAALDGGRVKSLGQELTLATSDFPGIAAAWQAFAARAGRLLPRAAAIAVAAPVTGDTVRMTNNNWVIGREGLPAELGVERALLINDFGAVAHAVAQLGPQHLDHLAGPDRPLPQRGTITVTGPGTGLGIAQLIRTGGGYQVVETEGAHIGFAPVDEVEDAILHHLRQPHGRVSVERVVSGPGLAAIYQVLARLEGRAAEPIDDRALWAAALEGKDALAAAALDRFCAIFGSVAGDFALAQGAGAVAVAGGLGLRLRKHLPRSGFEARFVAKGRYKGMMRSMPVKLITHPQPGLYGAAAAFAADQG